MGLYYQAQQQIRCWKQHRCVRCGALYRYLFDRQIVATGRTPQCAKQALHSQLQAALANAVDLWPCPHCGMYQPDMINQNQARWHNLFTLLTFGGLIVVLLLFGFTKLPPDYFALSNPNNRVMLFLIDLTHLSPYRFPWIWVGIGTVIAVGHYWSALRNPNRNMVANRNRAIEAIVQDKLILDQPGRWFQLSERGGPRQLPLTALVALAIGVLSSPMAEVVRIAAGWPLNQAAAPPVAGPGDTIRFFLPHTVSSVGGYWRATAQASVVGAEEHTFPVSSGQDIWGAKISTSDLSQTSTLWADVTVPDEPDLAGQTVQLQLDFNITYPQAWLPFTFKDAQESYSHTLELKLAPPRSGTVYYLLWWGGMLAYSLLLPLAGWLLVRRKQPAVSSSQVRVIPVP